jgi:beta-phosphoglucomutase-like phosphatase (HAD superfamily)
MPGILQCWTRWMPPAFPMPVGSNGTGKRCRSRLGQHGLIPRFRAVLSGQDMGRPKPAPDLYLAAARACGADPAAAW